MILERLNNNDHISLPDGKLLERLLMLKMYRENIPKSTGYYSRSAAVVPKIDAEKAPFLDKLLIIGNERLSKMKYVVLLQSLNVRGNSFFSNI